MLCMLLVLNNFVVSLFVLKVVLCSSYLIKFSKIFFGPHNFLRLSWVDFDENKNYICYKPGTPALPGGQGSLGGDLCKGNSWNSEGFQSGAVPMLLLVKETKSFIKEKKEEVLLVYFIVEIGLKSLRPFI